VPHAQISVKRSNRLATSVNAVLRALNAIQSPSARPAQAPEEMSLKSYVTNFLCDKPSASHNFQPLTANVERLASSGPPYLLAPSPTTTKLSQCKLPPYLVWSLWVLQDGTVGMNHIQDNSSQPIAKS
jgi:hypothetical protein